MKKILFAFLITIILFLTFLRSHLPPIALGQGSSSNIGQNIVTNYDEANFALIRENAGNNDILPVIVRIGPEVRDSAEYAAKIKEIETTAKKYNFEITLQPEDWASPDPITFQNQWVPVFQSVNPTGPIKRISLFTEVNYYFANPQSYAEILKIANQSNIPIPIGTTNFNLSNPTGTASFGQMQSFADFVSSVAEHCPDCWKNVDFISLSVYAGSNNDTAYRPGESVQNFLSQINNARSVLNQYGAGNKPIIIGEAGLWPSPKYPGGFEKRVKDTIAFATELENYLKDNPGISSGLNLNKVYFLLMNDETGQQFLIYKDKNGNWVVEGFEILGPGPLYTRLVCSTMPEAQKPTPLRPSPCKACGDPLPPQTNSCATPFQAIASGVWCLTPPACGGDYTETYNWGGRLKIDFTETGVPFAGYGNSTTADVDTETSPATSKYLADYFTGTLFYGDEKIDTSSTAKYSNELFRKAGVFRKLAPTTLQDELKHEMIGRAKRSTEGREFYPVEDYEIKNPNRPDCPEKTLIQFITGLGKKPLLKNYKTEEEYFKAIAQWEKKDNGCWAALWVSMPMFSLEDAPGRIRVSANPPGRVDKGYLNATFPHLTRLYESSKKTQQLLTPIISTRASAEVKAPGKIEAQACTTKSGAKGLITAIGCIPIQVKDIIGWIVQYGTLLGSGPTFLLMGYAVFLIITSAGDPEKIALAKKILTAAITGLLIIIFSVFLMQLIAAEILKIPGFSSSPENNQKVNLVYKPPLITSSLESPIFLANTQTDACQSCQKTQPKLLAQADYSVEVLGSSSFDQNTGIVTYQMSVQGYRPGGGIHPENFHVYVDDQLVSVSPNAILSDKYAVGIPGASGEFQLGPGENKKVSVYFWVKDVPEGSPQEYQHACTFSADKSGKFTTNCADEGLSPGTATACESRDIKPACFDPKSIMDANPNDPICISESNDGIVDLKLIVENYKTFISSGEVKALEREYQKCLEDCAKNPNASCECDPCSTVKLTRWINLTTEIPWLKEIWYKTANVPKGKIFDAVRSGIFNIFIPSGTIEPFAPTKAQTPIAEYSFENVYVQPKGSGGSVSPSSGWLYYPYLGGVEQAKKCISEQLLLPKELQLNQNLCPSTLTGKSIYDTTTQENREKGLCTNINYDIKYRNSSVNIDEKTKNEVIEKVKTSWPSSLIEERWDFVYEQAKTNGWNPAFVIALWIEETGASHFVQEGISQDAFGCNPTTAKSLEESLDCLFSRSYADKDFKEFMLTYSEGPDHKDEQFCLNPNFPGNIKAWYEQLTK